MATVTLTSSNSSAWSGYFYYNVDCQSVSGIYSVISIKAWAQKEDGYSSGSNSGVYSASITVNGTTKTLSSNGGYALTPSGTWIGSDSGTSSATFTVYHNSNGSVTCNVSITVTPPSGIALSGNTLTYDGTISVATIPRASSITSAGSVYFGSSCKVIWTPLSTSFYYKLKFTFGSWSYTTGAIGPSTTSSYTYTGYTIPYTAAAQIPSSTSGTMSVTLYTYSSSSCSTQVGSSSSATFTVTLPTSVVPTMSSVSVAIDNSSNEVVEEWGIALAGYTRVNVSATASGIYGSTITGFTITGSYVTTVTGTSLDYTGSIITSSGNKQFIVTCTDSRGRVSSTYTSDIIAFLSYTAPKVTKLSMSKDDDGLMVATATWTYDEVDGYNSSTATIYYKTTDATDWTTHSGSLTSGTAFTLTSLTPEETASYNFKVVVTDALGNSAEKDAFSSTTTVLMDFKAGGTGLGIGKICESDMLEVAMESIFFNEIYIGNNSTTLEDYIRTIMQILSSDMYGDALPSSGEVGQIFFKRVT